MPKYKSVSQYKPKIDPATGRTAEGLQNLGLTAWIPQNDAAKANKNMVERAVEFGHHKVKEGESPKEMQRKLLRRELKSVNIPIPPELQD